MSYVESGGKRKMMENGRKGERNLMGE